MNDENVKLLHIAGELISYFLKLKAKDIDFHIKILDDITEINIIARDLVLSPAQAQKLRVQMSNPRQLEVEGYYSNLAGGGHIGEELRLVSAMTDLEEITSSEAEGTIIRLRR